MSESVLAADANKKRQGGHIVVMVQLPDHREAEERIRRAMYRIRSNTALIGIATMSDRLMGYKPALIPTCATDGRHLYYFPPFVETLNDAELRFVMLHEIMHVAYSHHLRLEERNMKVANIAMDYMVNGILCATDSHRTGFIAMPQGGLHDSFFVGKKWSFEAIYNYLIANRDRYPQVDQALDEDDGSGDDCPKCGKPRAGPGDGDMSDDSSSSSDSGDSGSESQSGDDKCQCGGQPQPSDNEGQGSPRPGQMDGFGAWGEVWPAPQEVLDKASEEHKEIQDKLAEGEFMEKSFSPTGGSDAICGEVRDTGEDAVGWHHLKEYLMDVYSYERTWARPNLTRIGYGYYPSRDKTAGTMHVCLDTSGSVSNHELDIFLANTRAICEQIGVSTLKLAYVDSELRRPTGETWHEIDVASGEEVEFIISGRGGTNFDPVFNTIEEENEDVHCLVYFTDGWGGAYCRPPDFPVVWATTDTPVQWWGEWGEWGDTIQIAPRRM